MSNSSLQVPPVARVLASLTYTSICLIGLSMYVVIWCVMIKHWKEIKNPFYTVVCHLAVSDMGFSSIFVILMAPLMVSPTSVYPELVGFILPQLHTMLAVCLFLQGFTLTFERSAIFLCPRLHAELFEYGRVHYTVGITWVVAALMMFHPNVFGCHNRFDFRLYFQCTDPGKMVHLLPIMLVTGTFATSMMLMYVVVFVYLKKNKNNKVAPSTEEARRRRSRARAEYKLLLQGFIICFVLQVMSLSFWLVPNDRAWGPMLINLLLCINSACSPTIYLTLNKTIRAKVALLFGIKQPASVFSVKATTHKSKTVAPEKLEAQ